MFIIVFLDKKAGSNKSWYHGNAHHMNSQLTDSSPKYTTNSWLPPTGRKYNLVRPSRLKLLTQIDKSKSISSKNGLFSGALNISREETGQNSSCAQEDEDSKYEEDDPCYHGDSDIDSMEMGTSNHSRKQTTLRICKYYNLIIFISLLLNVILLTIVFFLLYPSYFEGLYGIFHRFVHEFYKSESEL